MDALEGLQVVTVAVDGPVARVTVNRPDKLNALNAAVLGELLRVARAFESRPELRVMVLTGAGEKAFVAGADIAEMKDLTAEQARSFSRAGHTMGEAFESAHYAIIAQVQGFALGGGCELALACDLIYAGEKARFGQPEVGLGVIPGFGGSQRLQRRVGVGRARELLLRGHVIDAAEAERIGLVERVFPQDRLGEEVTKIALQVAGNAPLAVAQLKRMLRAGADVPLSVANELESQAFGVCFGTEDQKAAMRNFVDNPRAPRTFNGR